MKQSTALLIWLMTFCLPAMGQSAVAIQETHFDQEVATIQLVNNSHREISAFNVSVQLSYADGTASLIESTEDFLPRMLSTRGTAFTPGEVCTLSLSQDKPFKTISPMVDVIVYTDGTAAITNYRAFKNIIARRKGTQLGLRKANELLATALANPNEKHPTRTVTNQLVALNEALHRKNLASDNPEAYEGLGLMETHTQLQHAPQTGEADYLQKLVERNQIRAAGISQHVEYKREVLQ